MEGLRQVPRQLPQSQARTSRAVGFSRSLFPGWSGKKPLERVRQDR